MPTKTVVCYVRCSSTQQAEAGVTIEAQKEALASHCAANGWTVTEVIVDAGVSGSVPLEQRPGGSQVIELVRRKKVSAVVAVKLDRIFRNAADALNSTDQWARKNVGLVLLDLGGSTLDTTSTMGRLLLTVMAGVGEAERALAGERTKAALAHKRKQGLRVSGKAPIGYSFEGDRVVENSYEQMVLSKARALRAQGYSFAKIAKGLNDKGYKCRGKKWYSTTLRSCIPA